MIRIGGRIPITIHPLFWVIAGLIGWINSQSLIGTIIWIGIIIVSVFIHEMGHALTALVFGKNPRIDFVAMGGVTTYKIGGLSYLKQFIIVLNGPLFGLLLFAAAWAAAKTTVSGPPIIYGIFYIMQVVNLFWTIVNLLPVPPLDGGQLLRIALEAFLGVKGLRISFLVGMIISIGLSFFFFAVGAFLIGALFFLFAFQSYDTWKKSKSMADTDISDHLKKMITMADSAIRAGRIEEAEQLLHSIREQTKEGILHAMASEYLAKIEYSKGKKEEAYALLKKIRKNISEDSIPLLHQLSYEHQDYQTVTELSTTSFEKHSTQETALINAYAFAALGKAEPAGGWLKRAYETRHFDVHKILENSIFDKVRNESSFNRFVQEMR